MIFPCFSFHFSHSTYSPDSNHSWDQRWHFVNSVDGPSLRNDVGSTSICSSAQWYCQRLVRSMLVQRPWYNQHCTCQQNSNVPFLYLTMRWANVGPTWFTGDSQLVFLKMSFNLCTSMLFDSFTARRLGYSIRRKVPSSFNSIPTPTLIPYTVKFTACEFHLKGIVPTILV